ncbi:hypothetical protein BC830DRAFT_1156554, partial [Chytriomyces sp. MP71]
QGLPTAAESFLVGSCSSTASQAGQMGPASTAGHPFTSETVTWDLGGSGYYWSTFADTKCNSVAGSEGYQGTLTFAQNNTCVNGYQLTVAANNGILAQTVYASSDCSNAVGLLYTAAQTPCQNAAPGNCVAKDPLTQLTTLDACTQANDILTKAGNIFANQAYVQIKTFQDSACSYPAGESVYLLNTCITQGSTSIQYTLDPSGRLVKTLYATPSCSGVTGNVAYTTGGVCSTNNAAKVWLFNPNASINNSTNSNGPLVPAGTLPASSPSSNITGIVGGIVGALLLVTLGSAFLLYTRHQRAKQASLELQPPQTQHRPADDLPEYQPGSIYRAPTSSAGPAPSTFLTAPRMPTATHSLVETTSSAPHHTDDSLANVYGPLLARFGEPGEGADLASNTTLSLLGRPMTQEPRPLTVSRKSGTADSLPCKSPALTAGPSLLDALAPYSEVNEALMRRRAEEAAGRGMTVTEYTAFLAEEKVKREVEEGGKERYAWEKKGRGLDGFPLHGGASSEVGGRSGAARVMFGTLELPVDPVQWNVEEAAAWLRQEGVAEDIVEFLKDQEMDGRALLRFNVSECTISIVGRRIHLETALETLKSLHNGVIATSGPPRY